MYGRTTVALFICTGENTQSIDKQTNPYSILASEQQMKVCGHAELEYHYQTKYKKRRVHHENSNEDVIQITMETAFSCFLYFFESFLS